jgi:ADP-ribose pyrophosphatase
MAEEIGIEAENLEEVGSFEPCNGLISELSHVFVARSLKPIIAHPDETEEIIIEKYSLDDFEKRIFSGEIWDGMTLAAWAIAKPYLKNSLIR